MLAAAALRADLMLAFTAFTVRSATCRTVCAAETRVSKTLIASKEQQISGIGR
jgi:hypothetical protein